MLGVTLLPMEIRDVNEFSNLFTEMQRNRVAGLISFPDTFFSAHRRRMAELELKHRIPTIHDAREFVEVGSLMAYGPSIQDLWRRAAVYVDKIFKGAKPADLPVEQPTKVELVINLKTAKALGLTITPSALARADELIE